MAQTTVYRPNSKGAAALVGRFAPSPTGRLHAGNIFSYLVAWIIARRSSGTVLLRIEDLDPARSRKEFADQAMRDLALLGLDWDGEPLYQSSRTTYYEEAFRALQREADVYPCFCTRADLHASSAPHAGEAPVYAGTCRALSERARRKKMEAIEQEGRGAAWRLALDDETIEFFDAFQGRCQYNLAADCGDFVIRRADGTFAYQLAVCVDDAAQGVNSVVRGCDLLQSTAMQIHLQRLLGFAHPTYAHVPLLVTQEGRRIAKREQDAGLDALLERFKTPQAVLGHIAYLTGLTPVDGQTSAEELLESAQLEALNKKNAIVWS